MIEIKIDYHDYGLHKQESATTIIRIDHDSSVFERIEKIESVSPGIVLKQHIRLIDDIADDITEAYEHIKFISARTDEFETRLQDTILTLCTQLKHPRS